MTPALTVSRASAAERPALAQMLELYQHDLSDLWEQDLDEAGTYGYGLDRYFDGRAGHHAFIARVDGRYAGFALVDGAVKVGSTGCWMDQFFVLKRYRRRGVGAALAAQVFAALPGPWEVGQMPGNVAARAFWRRVIGDATQGRFVEHTLSAGWWQGTVQCFQVP